MNVDVEAALQDLWVARRRRALAELDYRRAVLRVMGAGVSPEVVQMRLDVSPEALQGVLLRTRDTGVVPEGFSGASVKELCQRYEVGLLSAEQLEEELAVWPYELLDEQPPVVDHEGQDDPGGSHEVHRGTGEVPAEVAARWFSDGALEQRGARSEGGGDVGAARSSRGAAVQVPEPSGFRVSPDGQWREVEDALDAGLISHAMYRRVLRRVNPDVCSALAGPESDAV